MNDPLLDEDEEEEEQSWWRRCFSRQRAEQQQQSVFDHVRNIKRTMRDLNVYMESLAATMERKRAAIAAYQEPWKREAAQHMLERYERVHRAYFNMYQNLEAALLMIDQTQASGAMAQSLQSARHSLVETQTTFLADLRQDHRAIIRELNESLPAPPQPQQPRRQLELV